MPGKERRSPRSAHRDGLLPGEMMTVEEIADRYEGEWVLMRVTEYDEEGWPAKGLLLAHSPRQQDINLALEQRSDGEASPDQAPIPYYAFMAGPTLRSGPEYEAAVTEFVVGLLGAKRAASGPTVE
jgi:hypothetical protein